MMTHETEPHSHIHDDNLVAFLDGELEAKERARVTSHIERCWECRSRLRSLQAAIDRYVQAQRSLTLPDLPSAHFAVSQLRRRLAEQSADRTIWTLSYVLRPVLRTGILMLQRPAWSMVAVTLALIAFATTWFNAPLSASVVLSRSEVAERSAAHGAGDVVRTVCRVERLEGSPSRPTAVARVQTTADSSTPAVGVSVRLPDGTLEQELLPDRSGLIIAGQLRSMFGEALGSYLASRGWFPDISVSSYRSLAQDRGREDATARRVGDLIELTHPFRRGHPSGLAEIKLWVDGRSYLPRQLSLVTADPHNPREFRLSDRETERIARDDKLGKWFASAVRPSETPPPSGAVARRSPAPRPVPLLYADSSASQTEVAVAVRLHDLAADLGEEINVFPMSDGSVLVQGLVDDELRKREIEQNLEQLKGRVRVEIHTPSSLGPGTQLFESPWSQLRMQREGTGASPGRPVRPVPAAHSAFLEMLSLHFARADRAAARYSTRADAANAATNLANELVRSSTDILFHAWAVRRLDAQFFPARIRSLSPDRTDSLTRIRTDHRAAISKETELISGAITRVLPRLQVDETAIPASEGGSVLTLAIEQYELTTKLVTASAAASEAETAAARLLSVLSGLR
jgi:anti-sigma factor RsiW